MQGQFLGAEKSDVARALCCKHKKRRNVEVIFDEKDWQRERRITIQKAVQ